MRGSTWAPLYCSDRCIAGFALRNAAPRAGLALPRSLAPPACSSPAPPRLPRLACPASPAPPACPARLPRSLRAAHCRPAAACPARLPRLPLACPARLPRLRSEFSHVAESSFGVNFKFQMSANKKSVPAATSRTSRFVEQWSPINQWMPQPEVPEEQITPQQDLIWWMVPTGPTTTTPATERYSFL